MTKTDKIRCDTCKHIEIHKISFVCLDMLPRIKTILYPLKNLKNVKYKYSNRKLSVSRGDFPRAQPTKVLQRSAPCRIIRERENMESLHARDTF